MRGTMLRHAAALALVGWYLMVPPPRDHKTGLPDFQAALTDWSVEQSFNTADECRIARLAKEDAMEKVVDQEKNMQRRPSREAWA